MGNCNDIVFTWGKLKKAILLKYGNRNFPFKIQITRVKIFNNLVLTQKRQYRHSLGERGRCSIVYLLEDHTRRKNKLCRFDME